MRISRFPCRYLNTKLENFEKNWVSWKLSRSRLDGDKANPLKDIYSSYCYKRIDTLELSLSLSLSMWQNQPAFQAGFQKEGQSFFDLKISSNTNLPYLHVFASVLQKWQGSLLLADSAFPGCSGMNSNLQRCGRCFMRWTSQYIYIYNNIYLT